MELSSADPELPVELALGPPFSEKVREGELVTVSGVHLSPGPKHSYPVQLLAYVHALGVNFVLPHFR